ncbi:MAG: caspase family protein, partial [Pseudomonadota bacterium]
MLYRVIKISICATFLFSILALVAVDARARDNHAILVGAATYTNLDERLWLVGPTNDVDLVREFLLSSDTVPFEERNIAVLADGIEGAMAPTLGAIRQAMADLTERVNPGDFVYLHFSGHGSQMPARDPNSELDGLDEIFLPVDIGPWNDTVGEVPNALVDDEIGEMIQGLRARGASVWAVFDACHSGTVTRAAPTDDEVRLRRLPPSALSVPEDMMDGVQTRAVQTRAVQDPRARAEAPFDAAGDEGSFVAFFAAQTNETTPEKRLPRGKPGRRSQGVFTFTLLETLAANPGITYRQLGQEVLRRYSTENLARSTPMFEGDLDSPVFAIGGVDPVRQWPVRAEDGLLKIGAGSLHGMNAGSVLALMNAPTDETADAIGYASVTRSGAMTSDLAPVAHDGKAAVAMKDVPNGAYLRKIDEAISFGMQVALPENGSEIAVALQPAMPLLEDLLTEARISLVPAGQPADLRLGGPPD